MNPVAISLEAGLGSQRTIPFPAVLRLACTTGRASKQSLTGDSHVETRYFTRRCDEHDVHDAERVLSHPAIAKHQSPRLITPPISPTFYSHLSVTTIRTVSTFVMNVDPFLEPSNGPNYFPFDPNVLYEIKVDNDFNCVEAERHIPISLQYRISCTYAYLPPPPERVTWTECTGVTRLRRLRRELQVVPASDHFA